MELLTLGFRPRKFGKTLLDNLHQNNWGHTLEPGLWVKRTVKIKCQLCWAAGEGGSLEETIPSVKLVNYYDHGCKRNNSTLFDSRIFPGTVLWFPPTVLGCEGVSCSSLRLWDGLETCPGYVLSLVHGPLEISTNSPVTCKEQAGKEKRWMDVCFDKQGVWKNYLAASLITLLVL